MSLLMWRIVSTYIVPISFMEFIFIEILIAIGEVFIKFALNKAEGKPTIFEGKKDVIHPSENRDE